jgi:hypothetical protein
VGYYILCTITVTGTYCDMPFDFKVIKRGNLISNVMLRLTSTNSGATHSVNVFEADFHPDTFYVNKSADNIFQIICTKPAYSQVCLADFHTGSYTTSKCTIDFTTSFLSSLPSGAIQATQTKFVASTADNATNADTADVATKATVSLVNPTDSTFRYITFASGNNGNLGLGASNVGVHIRKGTTSQDGWEILQLGNGTASGTDGNKNGRIRLYGNSTGYMELRALNVTTSKYIELPDYSGTVQLEPKVLYDNSSGANSGTLTLSETSANFSYIEVLYFASTKYGSTMVASPNGKKVDLTIHRYTGSRLYIRTCMFTISGKSCTFSEGCQYNWGSGSTAAQGSTSNEVYVYKIIGYR